MRFTARLAWLGWLSMVACSSEGSAPAPASGLGTMAGDGEVPGTGAGKGGAVDPMGAEGPAASGEPSGSGTEGEADEADSSAGEGAPPSPSDSTGQGKPGVLTAGVWDDNRNFERFLGYRATLVQAGLPGLLPIDEAELEAAHEGWPQTPPAREKLDISLIIDTTGSMGDEISYLQAEFLSLSSRIAEQYPDAEQRWSLVAYKDDDDEYVARWFDFRSDAEDFRQNLAKLSAAGGGDFPEAAERALEAATQLSWRTAETDAKLAFWVADAPHHAPRATRVADALRDLVGLGVHVYPVASSGVDDLTELSMRTAAALTGGRYLFLTNDSGVGNDHKEPSIPCYFVTSLRDAIVRVVDIELSGRYHEPDTSEILRKGGDPQDGACKLASGQSVLVF